MAAANPTKSDIINKASLDFSYKNVMRYRDKYEDSYVVLPIILGAPVLESNNEKFGATIVAYDENYKNNLKYDWDEKFIIINKKEDTSLSWVEDDVLVIYGKYVGVETYYTTNQYTDKRVEVDRPVIEVYYDELTDDPFDSTYYTAPTTNSSYNSAINKQSSSVYNKASDDRKYTDGTDLTIGDYGDPGDDYDEYILYGSDSGLYGREYLEQLSDYELKLAGNEIYARHGRMFTSSDLQKYFNSKSWYTPIYSPEEFDALGDTILNRFEIENRNTIVAIENSRK